MAEGRTDRAGVRELFAIDTRSLALFRVLLGAVLLADLSKRALSLVAHYTDQGVLPRAELNALGAGPLFAPLHRLGGSPEFQAALFALAGALAVLLILGWKTRITSVLSFVLLVSLQQRNWLVLHAGDEMLRFLLLWGMFLPLGERWSLDARRRGTPAREAILSVASVALLLQIVFVYVGATYSKLQYAPWLEGHALYAVLNKATYATPLGTWLLQFPEFLRGMTWGALAFEGLAPILLFLPWRYGPIRSITVLGNVYFQVSIWLTLSIGLIQPISIVAALPFLPAWLWERLEARIRRLRVARDAPPNPPRFVWTALPDALCGVALAYVVASNLLSFSVELRRMPEPFARLGQTFLLDQRWHMFANTDATVQGWFHVLGYLESGLPIDVVHGTPAETIDRPELYALSFPNHNWRIYWSRIAQEDFAGFRSHLADYYCREWNHDAPEDLRATALEIVHVQERAVRPGEPIQREASRLIRRACPSAPTT